MPSLTNLENALIQNYVTNFKLVTKKDLFEVLTIHGKISKETNPYFTISMNDVLEIVNNAIPDHIRIYSNTIITPSRKTELVELRKIFACICLDLGYPMRKVYEKLKIHRTAVINYQHFITKQKELPNLTDIIILYNKILTTIKELHARNLQLNNQSKFDSKPGLSPVLHTGKGIPGIDQREPGAEITHTGMDHTIHAVDRQINLLSENAA